MGDAAAGTQGAESTKGAKDTPAPDASALTDGVVDEVEAEVRHDYQALRDFVSRHETQLLRFAQGDVIGHHPGAHLYAAGAPLRPIPAE